MSKNARIQGRLTEKEKDSLNMKDQDFIDIALELHRYGLLLKTYNDLQKEKEKALKKIKIN